MRIHPPEPPLRKGGKPRRKSPSPLPPCDGGVRGGLRAQPSSECQPTGKRLGEFLSCRGNRTRLLKHGMHTTIGDGALGLIRAYLDFAQSERGHSARTGEGWSDFRYEGASTGA